MHRIEHELRMKYIEEEHEMKVKEHLIKMEILNKKRMNMLLHYGNDFTSNLLMNMSMRYTNH